jgi:hypothetical protein
MTHTVFGVSLGVAPTQLPVIHVPFGAVEGESWVSSVDIVTRLRVEQPTNHNSIPGMGKRFDSFPQCPATSGTH